MKNLVFLVIVTSFTFFSCSTSKNLVKQDKTFTEFSLGIVENFELTPKMLESVQFFSSTDTIVLAKSTKVASGTVSEDGTLLLTGGEPTKQVIILPNTPGIIIPRGVILGDDKKIKELRVSFSEKENNYLIFLPSDDEFGSFVLSQTEIKSVSRGEGSPLMIKLFYLEEQDQKKIEPGRIVGQKKPTVNQKIIPEYKVVRN